MSMNSPSKESKQGYINDILTSYLETFENFCWRFLSTTNHVKKMESFLASIFDRMRRDFIERLMLFESCSASYPSKRWNIGKLDVIVHFPILHRLSSVQLKFVEFPFLLIPFLSILMLKLVQLSMHMRRYFYHNHRKLREQKL